MENMKISEVSGHLENKVFQCAGNSKNFPAYQKSDAFLRIKGKSFKVIIKPNSLVNSVIGFDDKKKAYIVKIKAKPVNNKANLELIRFLSKILQKKVKIKSGFKSREKIMEVNI